MLKEAMFGARLLHASQQWKSKLPQHEAFQKLEQRMREVREQLGKNEDGLMKLDVMFFDDHINTSDRKKLMRELLKIIGNEPAVLPKEIRSKIKL